MLYLFSVTKVGMSYRDAVKLKIIDKLLRICQQLIRQKCLAFIRMQTSRIQPIHLTWYILTIWETIVYSAMKIRIILILKSDIEYQIHQIRDAAILIIILTKNLKCVIQ